MYYYDKSKIRDLIPKFGFKFSKLYAKNHKVYSKNLISLWVIDRLFVEVKNIDYAYQEVLLDFILNNKEQPISFWQTDVQVGNVTKSKPNYFLTNKGNILSQEEYSIKGKAEAALYKADNNIDFDDFECFGLASRFQLSLTFVNDIISISPHLISNQ